MDLNGTFEDGGQYPKGNIQKDVENQWGNGEVFTNGGHSMSIDTPE